MSEPSLSRPLGGGRAPHRRAGGGSSFGRALLWLLVFVPIAWLAAQDVGVDNQLQMALVVLTVMLAMLVTGLAVRMRILFLCLAAFVTWRYFTWRIVDTLPDPTTWAFVPGILLFAAEVYGVAMLALGLFVNVRPIDRPLVPLPEDPSRLPTVDVFVPSYNESAELIMPTLVAARQMRYPAEKLRVHLLDDGGTEQKRNDRDPRKAAAAEERQRVLRALCESVGAEYRTRARNVHAKAGNINAALADTTGDLVVVFDADHVPTEDFLEQSIGGFLRDPALALVQTPHFFINPDPIERNLGTFGYMPSENEMFYAEGQRGLDSWNGSFFCGSAAVLRRSALMEIGGIQGVSITEDAETALELHSRGWHSAYVSRPMVAGLQPETFAGFIGQRSRWAQGMVQILILKNPLFKRGLSLAQRICYLSSMIYWLFPLARMLFILTPLAYLLFGMQIYMASLPEFIAYGVTHLAASLMITNYLFGKLRWPFISELYEITQAPFLARAVLSVFLRPRAPTFNVTAKSETLERRFVSHLARPLLLMFALLTAATGFGIWRWINLPLERDNLVIVLGWNFFNMLFLLGALGVVHEQQQRRGVPRVPRALDATLRLGATLAPVRITDLSIGGAQLVLPEGAALQNELGRREATLVLDDGKELGLHLRHVVVDDDHLVIGTAFAPADAAQRSTMVRLCYGSSDAWVAFQTSRRRRRTVPGGFAHFVRLVGTYGVLGLIAAITERGAGEPIAASKPAGRPLVLPTGGADAKA